MFFDFTKYTYYVATGGTDMRKGAESLSRMVIDALKLDPKQKSMFLFCNRSHKRIAVLVWDNGFWLMKKKIYSGTFAWPMTETEALKVSVAEVKGLIKGVDVFRRIPTISDGLLF